MKKATEWHVGQSNGEDIVRIETKLPTKTQLILESISTEMYDRLKAIAKGDLMITWVISNGEPKIDYLYLNLSPGCFRTYPNRRYVDAFMAARPLIGYRFAVYRNYSVLNARLKRPFAWKIEWNMLRYEISTKEREMYHAFITKYQNLSPTFKSSYKEIRFQERMNNQQESSDDEVRYLILQIGQHIAESLTKPYNEQTIRIGDAAQEIVDELWREKVKGEGLHFGYHAVNQLNFQHDSMGFYVMSKVKY